MSADVQLRTRQYIPDDSELHTGRRENLKSHLMKICLFIRSEPALLMGLTSHRNVKQQNLRDIQMRVMYSPLAMRKYLQEDGCSDVVQLEFLLSGGLEGCNMMMSSAHKRLSSVVCSVVVEQMLSVWLVTACHSLRNVAHASTSNS
jgi:hypothetical protein